MKRTTAARRLRETGELFDSSRILAYLDEADDATYAEGLDWYEAAHGEALTFAVRYSLTTAQAAGIIAAFSPQNGWENNLNAADLFLQSDGTREVHFRNCTERAREIYASPGADPLTILRGPKVRNFYRNIADPDHAGPVTIDRHACAVLAGLPTPEYLRQYPKFLERRGAYAIAEAHYRSAARAHSILPHEAQAIAWVAHRRRGADDYQAIPGL